MIESPVERQHQSNMISLNANYSTTRLLSNKESRHVNDQLPTASCHSARLEGGLRKKGYCKRSIDGMPLITVITVVYNGVAHLENSMLSVLGQNYSNVEYIIIDGRSTDGTISLLKEYDSAIDYWLSENDNGIYDAMNKAVDLSNGQWIFFLGSDDVLCNILEQVSTHLRSDETVYYGDVLYKITNKVYDGFFSSYKLLLKNISQQGIFYPRCIFDKYRFNQKYPYLADYELNIRCYFDTGYIFEYIPLLISVYNDENGKSTIYDDVAFYSDKLDIIKQNCTFFYRTIYSSRFYVVMLFKALRMKTVLKKFLNFIHRDI